ncbi:MAG: serine/threonine protein kinase [Planctomycetes bacterium]|nr:serine/threonine protein kinase [Planctomycetota bacterium]
MNGHLGSYTLLGELGRGGMGQVFRARHGPSGREVALKRLLPAALGELELVARFRREALALRGVAHPNLVAVLDAQLQGPEPFIVFELVEGATLRQRVEREGPLPWRTATRVLREVAAGLGAAHELQLLHRDVKPDNVLLGREGAKLADFGLVKPCDLDSLTRTQAGILGTLDYAAPEQAANERERLGPATDTYGLAATLYFALTGRDPFRRDSPLATLRAVLEEAPPSARAQVRGVPKWLDAVCARGMAKDPRARYPSAIALRAALNEPTEQGLSRRFAAAGAFALTLGAAGLATFAWSNPRRDPPAPPLSPEPSALANQAPSVTLGGVLEGLQSMPPVRTVDELQQLVQRLREADDACRLADTEEAALTRERLWELTRQNLIALSADPGFGDATQAPALLLELVLDLADQDRARLVEVAAVLSRARREWVENRPGLDLATLLQQALQSPPASLEEDLILTTLLSRQPSRATLALGALRKLLRRPDLSDEARLRAAKVALTLREPALCLSTLQPSRPDVEADLGREALLVRLAAHRALGFSIEDSYLKDVTALEQAGVSVGAHRAWALVALGRWPEARAELERLRAAPPSEGPELSSELRLLGEAIAAQEQMLPPAPGYPAPDPRLASSTDAPTLRGWREKLGALREAQVTSAEDLQRLLSTLRAIRAECDALPSPDRQQVQLLAWRNVLRILDTLVDSDSVDADAQLTAALLSWALERPLSAREHGDLLACLTRNGARPAAATSEPARELTERFATQVARAPDAFALYSLALAYYRQEPTRPARAHEALRALAELDPGTKDAKVRAQAAVLAADNLGEPELALALLDARWLEVAPADLIARGRVVRLYAHLRRGDPEAIVREVEALERLGSATPLQLLEKAKACAYLGRWDEAAELLRRLQARPEAPQDQLEPKLEGLREAIERRDPRALR